MASRLLSRQRLVPGGFRFYIPTLPKWKCPKGSFDIVVQSAIAALVANKTAAQRLGWDLTYDAMANRIDEYNAAVCAAQGWDEYISATGGQSLPKLPPEDQQKALQSLKSAAVTAKELILGAKTLIEWKASGEKPVSQEQAEKRAAVCVQCNLNEAKDWTAWFTKPAANLIKKQVEEIHALNLKTSVDDKLHCCTACHCPLQVKVWPGIDWITKRLSQAQLDRLRAGKNCWIIVESGK